jgi:hypothetical protein
MNNTRNLVIGGALLLSGAGALWYFANREKKSSNIKNREVRALNKELTILLLKEIQREMYNVLNQIAMIANQLRESTGEQFTRQQLKDIILHESGYGKSWIIFSQYRKNDQRRNQIYL